MAKKETYKDTTAQELSGVVAKKRDELKDLRFAASGSKTRNVKQARTLRHDIARALTRAQALAAK